MNHPNRKAEFHARDEKGFTLIESLVAMVVISVGMLGIAAMYVEGLRAGRTSVYRTVAVELASDMADRIRANPTAVAAYAGAAAGANLCVNTANDCTAIQLAANDLFWWEPVVAARLPGGTSNITVAGGADTNTYTITINWSEPGVPTPLQYAVSVQL